MAARRGPGVLVLPRCLGGQGGGEGQAVEVTVVTRGGRRAREGGTLCETETRSVSRSSTLAIQLLRRDIHLPSAVGRLDARGESGGMLEGWGRAAAARAAVRAGGS